MAQSDSDPTINELCSRLAEAKPTAEPAVMGQIWRLYLDDPSEWSLDPTAESVEILQSYLDHENPELRSGAAFVLGSVVTGTIIDPEAEEIMDKSELAGQLLELIDDESPRVRQVAVSTGIHGGVVGEMLEDDSFPATSKEDRGTTPKPIPWLAIALFEHLQDPAPIVRKRVASYLDSHAVELLEQHPEASAAIGTLVDTLGDNLDALAPDRDAATPRDVAARTLREVATDAPELLLEHIDHLNDYLDVDDDKIRIEVAKTLGQLIHTDHLDRNDVAKRVVDCLATEGRAPKLLASAALAVDDRSGTPEAALTAALQAGRSERRNRCADTLARYVRQSDRSHEPPLEAVAQYADTRPFTEREEDPFVMLAADYPGFVTECLVDWQKSIVDGSSYSAIDDDLVIEIWDQNQMAIDEFLDYAVETAGPAFDYERSGSHHLSPSVQTLNDLAKRRPEIVADIVPDIMAARGRSPPLDEQVSGLVEAVAEVGPQLTDETIAALEGTLRSTEGNLGAARALAALSMAGHDAVDDDYEIFVAPYRDGELDGSSYGGKYALPPVATEDPEFVTEVLYDIFDHWGETDADGGPTKTLAAVGRVELAAVEPILDDLVAVTLSSEPADERIEKLSENQLFDLVKFYISGELPNSPALFRQCLDALVPVVAYGSTVATSTEEVSGHAEIPGRFDPGNIVDLIDAETTLVPELVESELATFVETVIEPLLSPQPSAMDLHLDIAKQIGFGHPVVFESHVQRLLDAAEAATDRKQADLVGYMLCELGAETPDTIEKHIDRLSDLATDGDIASSSVAVGTLGKLLKKRPGRANAVAGPLGAALPDIYMWARRQAVKALKTAAEENPQAIREVVPDLVAVLAEFDGVSDEDNLGFVAGFEIKDTISDAFSTLDRVAEEYPESVLVAFEPYGGIESVEVPGWSDQLSDLRTKLDA